MIRLTRLNHVPMLLNSDLIEHVEVTPDTVVSLTTGQKFMVLESADEIIERVIQYRRATHPQCRYPKCADSGDQPGANAE
jgi:flagellar protein FlbD